jgi:hypothetical protein
LGGGRWAAWELKRAGGRQLERAAAGLVAARGQEVAWCGEEEDKEKRKKKIRKIKKIKKH